MQPTARSNDSKSRTIEINQFTGGDTALPPGQTEPPLGLKRFPQPQVCPRSSATAVMVPLLVPNAVVTLPPVPNVVSRIPVGGVALIICSSCARHIPQLRLPQFSFLLDSLDLLASFGFSSDHHSLLVSYLDGRSRTVPCRLRPCTGFGSARSRSLNTVSLRQPPWLDHAHGSGIAGCNCTPIGIVL
jgi:hypothetical protein